jgi:methylmalonyl-CoA mutase cobalamin-binding domain/chain
MLDTVKTMVITGKLKKIEEATQAAIDNGISPSQLLDTMIDAMNTVGDLFQKNEIYVPEMLVAAKTMQRGVKVLKPHLANGEVGKMGKCVIGTVAGDLHDIGKNLVAMMIEAAGFEIIDLGVDVPAEKFVEAVRDNPDCKIVGVSALLTTTMAAMKDTVTALIDAGFKDQVKIMVGGAPVTPEFAAEICADAFTADAASAAAKAKELVG